MRTPTCLFSLLLLFSAGPAFAQDEPIPLPFTRDALKVVYKQGLLMRYVRTTYRQGTQPKREYVFNKVLEHSPKGYLLRTMIFDAAGNLLGKIGDPKPIPYRVESKSFRSAKEYAYERIRLGSKEHSAHKYVYQVQRGSLVSSRTTYYSAKHRGLLLKTVDRPSGQRGKKNYQTLELIEIPAKLRGKKERVGAEQGNLPWSHAKILKAWPANGWAEYQVVTKSKKDNQTYRLRQTMIASEASCYVLREQVWDEKDTLKGDAGRPQLWRAWLGALRSARPSTLKKLLDKEIEAAGRKWPCKVYKVQGRQTVTWYLSKEVPGLIVRLLTRRDGQKLDQNLTKINLPLPKGG